VRNIRQAFDSFIGNASLKQKLLSDICSGSLSHAYIIEGKKGSGRHTLAYLIAAALSCEKLSDNAAPLPCLTCDSCRKILEQKSPDVITLKREEGKATFGVDIIRTLKSDIHTVPNDLEYKVYVIEDADTMTTQAQNAFLLSLEEPPAFVKYFLLCEDAHSLLETIRSRSLILKTEAICEADIDAYLQKKYEAAQKLKKADEYAYNELIMASENCIGRSIDLLDPKIFEAVSYNRKLARDFINAIAYKQTGQKAVEVYSRFDGGREEFSKQLAVTATALRDLIALQRTENAPLLFYNDREEALSLSDMINIRKLMNIYDSLRKAETAVTSNANVKLTLVKLFSESELL
jgi:DNA polymerase-3 subunit delta'